jgi:hypothetical protein
MRSFVCPFFIQFYMYAYYIFGVWLAQLSFLLKAFFMIKFKKIGQDGKGDLMRWDRS